MHLLFVDESGTAPNAAQAAKNPIFVMGGLVIPEDVWPKIKDDLEIVKRRFAVTGEIKWRFFTAARPGSKPNPLSHLDATQKEALRTDLLALIVKYKAIKLIVAVVDTVQAYQQYHINTPDDLYHDAFKKLSERFQYFLQDLERASGVRMNGMIVCDNRNNDQDNRLKEFHQTLLTGGGRFTSNYGNLIEGLFIAASHHSIGTQFADIVAGAVFRDEARNDPRFKNQILTAFRASPSGRIPGYGIVYIPKK